MNPYEDTPTRQRVARPTRYARVRLHERRPDKAKRLADN
jgi:hypothetical protein